MTTDKHARTIRLTPEIHERLTSLCEHFGITANAYITQAIGKSIAQDEIAFNLKKNQQAMFESLPHIMKQMIEAEEGKTR